MGMTGPFHKIFAPCCVQVNDILIMDFAKVCTFLCIHSSKLSVGFVNLYQHCYSESIFVHYFCTTPTGIRIVTCTLGAYSKELSEESGLVDCSNQKSALIFWLLDTSLRLLCSEYLIKGNVQKITLVSSLSK